MDQNRTRRTVAKLVYQAALPSGRVRRRIMEFFIERPFTRCEDVDLRFFDKKVITALQEESRTMDSERVLMYNPSEIARMAAKFRGLKPTRCHSLLCESDSLVTGFVEAIRGVPQQEIAADSAAGAAGFAAGWAPKVQDRLLIVTGAEKVVAVEFPLGQLPKHAVWVEKDMVLVSGGSLAVDLGNEDIKTLKGLYDIISCSTNQSLGKEKLEGSASLDERDFESYHLVVTRGNSCRFSAR